MRRGDAEGGRRGEWVGRNRKGAGGKRDETGKK